MISGMNSITLYGITQCDSVKKAREWLHTHGLDYTFHDFRKQGVPEQELQLWVSTLGWERLLNRQGTTWRKLQSSVQCSVQDAESAQALMLAHSSIIKRPVIRWASGKLSVGFAPDRWPLQDF
jgi:arsenate reductase